MRARVVSSREFRLLVESLEGKGYGAYRKLLNNKVDYEAFTASLTHVQGDPHAPPSYIEVIIPRSTHRFPPELMSGDALVPFTDYLARKLYSITKSLSRKCGLGNSCFIGVPKPSPRILRRSCVEVAGTDLVIRFFIGLPASGRRILGREAADLLLNKVRRVVDYVLKSREELAEIREHIKVFRLQEGIREWLRSESYVFFIGEGAVLPRRASFSQEPMPGAVPFTPPPSLTVEVCVEDAGCVKGMTVREGVTVITGGAYHGKTTLLEAIQEGIYNHIKGDGRELVVSVPDTVLVRAEDGRVVNHVDISAFIKTLPNGTDTSDYTTLDASGSTSMAAAISEAIEVGCRHIVLDEDISATNLLYKDKEMAKLLHDDPITPLNTLVKLLSTQLGVSTTAVVSASSSFLKPADTVILMRKYVPEDATQKAKALIRETTENHATIKIQHPKPRTYAGIRNLRKIKATGRKIIAEYENGLKFEVNLRHNPRIVEDGQARMIAHIIRKHSRQQRETTIKELITTINHELKTKGFKAYAKPVPPDLTEVTPIDVIWVINRLYQAQIKQKETKHKPPTQ